MNDDVYRERNLHGQWKKPDEDALERTEIKMLYDESYRSDFFTKVVFSSIHACETRSLNVIIIILIITNIKLLIL
jgi:hypothetical protein